MSNLYWIVFAGLVIAGWIGVHIVDSIELRRLLAENKLLKLEIFGLKRDLAQVAELKAHPAGKKATSGILKAFKVRQSSVDKQRAFEAEHNQRELRAANIANDIHRNEGN